MANRQQILQFFAKRADFLLPEFTAPTTGKHYGQIKFGIEEVVIDWEYRPNGSRLIKTIPIDDLIAILDLLNLSTMSVQGLRDHINALGSLTTEEKATWIGYVDKWEAAGVFDP